MPGFSIGNVRNHELCKSLLNLSKPHIVGSSIRAFIEKRMKEKAQHIVDVVDYLVKHIQENGIIEMSSEKVSLYLDSTDLEMSVNELAEILTVHPDITEAKVNENEISIQIEGQAEADDIDQQRDSFQIIY